MYNDIAVAAGKRPLPITFRRGVPSMALASILLIESGRPSAPSFASALEKKGFAVQVCHKVPTAVAQARKNAPDVLVLDAASMHTSGTRMCRTARSSLDGIPIILISPEGTDPDPGSGSTVNLLLPFTPRKLVNRVHRLLPGDERYTIEAGPIKLNLAQRKVRGRGGGGAARPPPRRAGGLRRGGPALPPRRPSLLGFFPTNRERPPAAGPCWGESGPPRPRT